MSSRDVVDLHPRELLHRPGDALSATPVDPALERRVDPPLTHPGDVLDPQVAGERDEHHLPAIRAGVHEDDRVRAVLAADVGVVAERDDLLLREPLARVAAEQQVVARALVAPAGDVHGSGDT
jgi:hypothetical protein